MSNLLAKLNNEQREAVATTEGPLLMLAGAGSGKTRALTYRIAYLVEECGVAPWHILAITFTNKAAAEMKDRLVTLIGDKADDMWIRTFHSACVRILRRDIDKIGYDKSFAIYDSDDQKTLVKECIKQLNFSEKDFTVSSVIGYISSAKDELIPPDEYCGIYADNFQMLSIGKIYKKYQSRLAGNNAVDFDDLICLTVRLFKENPDVLHYYRNKFRYIHVDEYQDTNNAQYELIRLLSGEHRNLCVVGDDDQSIYKFRGANIKNILNFEESFPDAKVIRLEQNYRSTQNILDAANGVIQNNFGRKGKNLWTDNGQGEKIIKYEAESEKDEANFIAEEIWKLNKEQNISYSDIAILYRTNAQSRTIEESLMRTAVPYKIMAGHRFYDKKEIRDVVAYLRVLNNSQDDVSLARIINEPKRKIGKTSVANISLLAADRGTSIFHYISNPENYEKLGTAKKQIADFAMISTSIGLMV
jgi:DNA helicase-2/ATP-dependent DNA helicase PcrA